MNIFSVRPGVAIAVPDPEAVPAIISVQGWGGFTTRNALINGIQLTRGENFTIAHSLRDSIYISLFGERIGEFSMRGLVFQGKCDTGVDDGLSQIMEYYDSTRLTSAKGPIAVQYGRFGFNALLVGASYGLSNPSTNIGEFTFQLKLLPPR